MSLGGYKLVEDVKKLNLLPCPFCNSDQLYIGIGERNRVDVQKTDRLGRVRQHAGITHFVSCTNCGAESGHSFNQHRLDFENARVTDSHIFSSIQEAVAMWNMRGPINEKAFDLVNALIVSAIESIEKADTVPVSTSTET